MSAGLPRFGRRSAPWPRQTEEALERDADYAAGVADALAHLGDGHAICSGAAGPVIAVVGMVRPNARAAERTAYIATVLVP